MSARELVRTSPGLPGEFALCARLLTYSAVSWSHAALGDPTARLLHAPWREHRYAIHPRLRQRGPLTRSRLGVWVATTHELCDAVLRDRRFGVRTPVLVLLGSAGRDPERHEHPEQFDITRSAPGEHLAFSSGAHYCLGAALARMEGKSRSARWPPRCPGWYWRAVHGRAPVPSSTGWQPFPCGPVEARAPGSARRPRGGPLRARGHLQHTTTGP